MIPAAHAHTRIHTETCVGTHAHIHIGILTWAQKHICTCISTHPRAHIHACPHVHLHTYTYMNAHPPPTHTHTFICKHTHKHIHTYILIHRMSNRAGLMKPAPRAGRQRCSHYERIKGWQSQFPPAVKTGSKEERRKRTALMGPRAHTDLQVSAGHGVLHIPPS